MDIPRHLTAEQIKTQNVKLTNAEIKSGLPVGQGKMTYQQRKDRLRLRIARLPYTYLMEEIRDMNHRPRALPIPEPKSPDLADAMAYAMFSMPASAKNKKPEGVLTRARDATVQALEWINRLRVFASVKQLFLHLRCTITRIPAVLLHKRGRTFKPVFFDIETNPAGFIYTSSDKDVGPDNGNRRYTELHPHKQFLDNLAVLSHSPVQVRVNRRKPYRFWRPRITSEIIS